MAFYVPKQGIKRFGDMDTSMAGMSLGIIVIVAFGGLWLWLSGGKKKG
jgi:hypothetical protein